MKERSLLVVLLEAAVAVAPVLILAYTTEPGFRYGVDRLLEQARYRLQLGLWRARHWDRWSPHERERWEERHGLPEV